MICTARGCEGRLRVTHTYSLASSKHQRAVCAACGRVHCLSTTVAVVAGRGDGARARARKAALREAPIQARSDPSGPF